jgi:hypothetical protein
MMGGQRPWFTRLRGAVDHWAIGPLVFRLNVSRFVMIRMAQDHVYEDPSWLSGDRLAAKLAVTRAPGAWYASVRFVTGALDRVESRAAFLDLARGANVPMLVIYGDRTPPRSRAEMEALAAAPGVELKLLPHGKLLIHEEFPDAAVATIDRSWFCNSSTRSIVGRAAPLMLRFVRITLGRSAQSENDGLSRLRALIAVAGSLRRLPIRPKQPGASKGATTNFTAPAY